MEDRPGSFQQTTSNNEGRSLTSLNPIARAAAMAAQTSISPTPAASAESPIAAPPSTPAVAPRPSVGKLARVDASHLWADGAALATWLAANVEALGEALSVPLRDGRMTHTASSVVMATDPSGATAVIVCELGAASDEGFGRLVRNVAASNARHAVWVCGETGDEYGASVSWLNRAVEARVSMVKVSAVTIGDSAAAPMFEVRVRTPRESDDGVDASVPAADAAGAAPATRRVDDWLERVGAGDGSS